MGVGGADLEPARRVTRAWLEQVDGAGDPTRAARLPHADR
jgi:hypothetical protein